MISLLNRPTKILCIHLVVQLIGILLSSWLSISPTSKQTEMHSARSVHDTFSLPSRCEQLAKSYVLSKTCFQLTTNFRLDLRANEDELQNFGTWVLWRIGPFGSPCGISSKFEAIWEKIVVPWNQLSEKTWMAIFLNLEICFNCPRVWVMEKIPV